MKAKGTQIGFFAGVLVIALVLRAWADAGPQSPGRYPEFRSTPGIEAGATPRLEQGSTGQMTELVSEVKLMRAALEEMSRGQTQVQALGIQIAAQQSRIAQASASLDSTSAQLSEVAMRAREVARELAANQVLVARTPDPNQRAVAQQRVSDLKQLLSDLTNEEAQLRSRISRLTATLTQEENRSQQLSAKLDAMARR